jgi:glutamate synthase domain-containing protein 3
MYGGKIFLRCNNLPFDIPKQIEARVASNNDMEEINTYLEEFCNEFNFNKEEILLHNFYVLTPHGENKYKQLYINN